MKLFHPFRLDTVNQCVWREQTRLPLTPKAFDVLRYLVEHQARQQELDALLQERFPSELEPTQSKTTPRLGLTDSALIEKALGAKSGPRFRKLWYGDTSDYDGDHSRADAALCRMLSFWTGGDAERIDRLFRLSGLMRGKWDRRTGRETYGARTIRISSRLRAH